MSKRKTGSQDRIQNGAYLSPVERRLMLWLMECFPASRVDSTRFDYWLNLKGQDVMDRLSRFLNAVPVSDLVKYRRIAVLDFPGVSPFRPREHFRVFGQEAGGESSGVFGFIDKEFLHNFCASGDSVYAPEKKVERVRLTRPAEVLDIWGKFGKDSILPLSVIHYAAVMVKKTGFCMFCRSPTSRKVFLVVVQRMKIAKNNNDTRLSLQCIPIDEVSHLLPEGQVFIKGVSLQK